VSIETHQLLMFIAAGWLLNLTPGPDVLYIVSNALRSGTRAGIVAGLGITAGCFVHIFAAAVGVGALLATSAAAFTVLKWLGAAYLLWMGVRMLFSRAGGGNGAAIAAAQAAPQQAVSLRGVFLGGFWTNVLNPKVAIFFLAFVPQFIAPATQNKALAFVLLGVLFNVNAIPVNAMPITPQEALQRTIEHREIFHDEMLHLMRLIMSGEMLARHDGAPSSPACA
jgi:threonine/homoserine/homoserine lactone efflux protein